MGDYTYTISVKVKGPDGLLMPTGPMKVELEITADPEGAIEYREYATRDEGICSHIRGRGEGEPIGVYCTLPHGHQGAHAYPPSSPLPCMHEMPSYWDSGVQIRRFCALPTDHDGEHSLSPVGAFVVTKPPTPGERQCDYSWHRMENGNLTRVQCTLSMHRPGWHQPVGSP